jgi:ribonuclease P protein component
MVLFALPTEGSSRFGVTASRKVGNAVFRARCRRRLRELYRLRASGGWSRPVDLVANARRSCARVPWTALVSDFDNCVRKLESKIAPNGATPPLD